MSWYRQVKAIYSAAYLMFIFICYSLVAILLFKENIGFISYLLLLACLYLMQYLEFKEKSRMFSVAFPSILSAAASYFMYPLKFAVITSVFNIIMLIFLEKLEQEEINHDVYKNRLKIALFILAVAGLGTSSLNNNNAHWIFRYYILFLILAILTLREARNFCNKIRNKKSTVTNCILIILGIIATTDYTITLISKFYSYILAVINLVLLKISDAVSYTIFKPMKGIIDYLISKWSLKHVDTDGVGGPSNTPIINDPSKNSIAPKIISIILFIVIILCIMKFLIILYKKINSSKGQVVKNIEKERIYNSENNGRNKIFSKLINKLFRKDKSIRGQILYIYSKFQHRMKLRDIFRPSMTATQLSNVSRVKIDDYEALDCIKNIYNEAKFSVHEIPKEKVNVIEEKYERVKNYR